MTKGQEMSEEAAKRSVNELKEILESYIPGGLIDKTISLLALHLYEISDGCRRYSGDYEAIFSAPKGSPGRENVADRLTRIKVLLEDVSYHIEELTKELDFFLDRLDAD